MRAIDDHRALAVELVGIELAHRDVHRFRDPARFPLVLLANVDQLRRALGGEKLVRPSRVDLVE